MEYEEQSSRSPVNFLMEVMSKEEAERSGSVSSTATKPTPQNNISMVMHTKQKSCGESTNTFSCVSSSSQLPPGLLLCSNIA